MMVRSLPGVVDDNGGSFPDVADDYDDSLPGVAHHDGGSLPGVAEDDGGSLPGVADDDGGSIPGVADDDSGSLPSIADDDSGSLPGVADHDGSEGEDELAYVGEGSINQPTDQCSSQKWELHCKPFESYLTSYMSHDSHLCLATAQCSTNYVHEPVPS